LKLEFAPQGIMSVEFRVSKRLSVCDQNSISKATATRQRCGANSNRFKFVILGVVIILIWAHPVSKNRKNTAIKSRGEGF
jgi:hypothetical protein